MSRIKTKICHKHSTIKNVYMELANEENNQQFLQKNRKSKIENLK